MNGSNPIQRVRAGEGERFLVRANLAVRMNIFAVACSILFSLQTIPGAESKPAAKEKPPCCREIEGTGHYTDKSLYQLESTWTSDVEKKVKLGVLQGHIQVVALFFASCEFACPLTVHDMKAVQAALPENLRERVEFLLVSFDTERDTPEALRAYRKKMDLDATHWTLLRGEPDDVRELAALLGINYKKDARGQFAHTNMITILNEQGEIALQKPGLNHNPAEIIQALQKLPKPEKSSRR